MSIENPKIGKEGREPIIDIELNEGTLETWEKYELNEAVDDLIFGFEDLVEPDDRFILHPANFEITDKFVKGAEKSLEKLGGRNFEEKMKEVENEARKAILNFTFKELEIDPKNPVLLKEEEREENGKKLKIKHYANAYPGLVLATDNIDWWLERK